MPRKANRQSLKVRGQSRNFSGELTVNNRRLPPRRRVLMALRWVDYETYRGVATYAHEVGWLLSDASEHDLPTPKESRWDGIITLLRPTHLRLARQLLRFHVPVVDLNNELRSLRLPSVLADNHAIGRMVAEHLLSRGLRNLAYYQEAPSMVERERREGFREAALAAGAQFIHMDSAGKPGMHRFSMRQRRLCAMLRKLPLPIGIMGQYDGSANEVALACQNIGLAVPEKAAIVGVDNDPVTSQLGLIPLTSVDNDRFRIGYEGARLLDRLMVGERPPKEPIRIQPKGVHVRQSSDILTITEAAMERSLRFIWNHFAEPIGVDEVARVAAVSRRKLYNLFERHLGRTIREEIERVRLEEARRMLHETDGKVSEIAKQCGFVGNVQMCRVFKAKLGVQPTAFRLQQRESKR